MNATDPIGFFASGLGGISILRTTLALMPGEDFLYYGDSNHAPYGVRSAGEILELSRGAVRFLLERNAKAVVIACNTATAAAAASLREEYPDLPIIGTEPAVKPAAGHHPGGRVLVMATPTTLQEHKFLDLWERLHEEAVIIPVPCGGLMEFVERGELDGERLDTFLRELLGPYMGIRPDAVVLGCTHYPFLIPALRKVLGEDMEFLDGSMGVARQVQRRLEAMGLCNPRSAGGRVTFYNSLKDDEILQRCTMLLKL